MTSLKVNGQVRVVGADADTPLLWVLREELGLTGTKFGCGAAACGACTVHLNGEPVRSCALPVGDAAGADIVTIEGIAAGAGLGEGALHPVQRAWIDIQVPAVRLLPVRHDHGDGGAPEEVAEADRCGDRRRHRQSLPLRHLSPGAPRDPRLERPGIGRPGR